MNRSASPAGNMYAGGNAYATPPMQQQPQGPYPQGPYPQGPVPCGQPGPFQGRPGAPPQSYAGPPPPGQTAPMGAGFAGFAPAMAPVYNAAHNVQDAMASGAHNVQNAAHNAQDAMASGAHNFQDAMAPVYNAAHRVEEAMVPVYTNAKTWAKEPVRSTAVPKWAFISVGLLLLIMLCVVPVWNAFALMTDGNFVFWVGRVLPVWMIVICFSIVLFYLIVCLFYFSYSSNPGDERSILMMANLFVMMLGMALMITSLPLTRNSVDTYNNLMYRCDYSDQTHRMWEYSQVLHNIRMQPECAQKFTVEECAGYADAAPYTSFLKAMENEFRCSGFCYRAPTPVAMALPMPAPAPAPAPAVVEDATSLLGHHRAAMKSHHGHKHHHQHGGQDLSFLEVGKSVSHVTSDEMSTEEISESLNKMAQPMPIHALYPPTLFSDANYQASCEGMAARDIRNFGGDIGYQTFYQGVYLVGIAIVMGVLKMIGFCIPNGGEAFERATENMVKGARNTY